MLRLHDVRSQRRFSQRCLTVFVCLTFGWQLAVAAEPRRELWELVHKDVGIAVEVRGLSEQSRRLIGSELFQRIQRHSAWKQVLGSSEVKHLAEMQRTIGEVTGQSLISWADKLFGQEAVLTLTPEPTGRPRSLLLTRLKRREDLPEILAAWDKLEPRTETRLRHRDREYFRRVKIGGSEALFFTLVDDILAISDSAAAVTPVLDLALEDQHQNALSRASSFQKVRQALNPAAAVRVIVQPGAWQVWQAGSEPKTPSDPVERWMHQVMAGCQIIGVGVRLESGLVAEVVAQSDELAQFSHWSKIVDKTSGMPSFLSRVPNSAVLAFAGRHDLSDIADWILSNLSTEQLKKLKSVRQVIRGFLLGNDLFDDVLPQFPADFGGFVIPRHDLQLASAPVDGLFAISLPPRAAVNGADAPRPTARQAIENALSTGTALVIALHNSGTQKEASLEESEHNGVIVHWVDNMGPIQPAYALAPDYLLAATSPQLIRDFLSQSPTATWATDNRLRKLQESLFPDASQVTALQGELLRKFLTEHRGFLLKQLEAVHKLKPEEAGKRLDRMLEWVQLSDRLFLASSLHADHVKLVLAITVSEGNAN